MTSAHWDEVYRSKPVDSVSWFQNDPEPSLSLLVGARSVIDIGSGASELVDALLSREVSVTCLDISETALALTRARLGSLAERVEFVRADILQFEPTRQWEAWHDRAVFHFLTDPVQQRDYVHIARRALPVGGRVVLGCFAPDGPEQCSGLPVARHDAAEIAAIFTGFTLVSTERRVHRTPWDAEQQFTWSVLERNP